MRVMSLDVGSRTIGVAVSDFMGLIANGAETIKRAGVEQDFSYLGKFIRENEVDTVVIGYPKNMNGTIGESAQISENFANEMRCRFPKLQVVLWDERLTTVVAEKVLIDADVRRGKRKNVIDKLAAVVILQNYIDSRRF